MLIKIVSQLFVLLLQFNEISNQLFRSRIFDSYGEKSALEPYPNVCNGHSDENCARKWLQRVNEIMIRNNNRLANVNFKYATNINGNNLRELIKMKKKSAILSWKMHLKAKKFRLKFFKSPWVKRSLEMLKKSSRIFDSSTTLRLIDIRFQIENIYNTATPCFKGCQPPGEPGIIEIFNRVKDYDDLAGYWVAWRNATGSRIRNLFIERMNLENQKATDSGFHDSAEFKLATDFQETNFSQKLRNHFDNIFSLYKELHGYVRHCLHKYYPNRFNKSGPIPAHIVGSPWSESWHNVFSILKKCHKNIHEYDLRKEIDENIGKLTVHEMFKLSESFYSSLGMHNMTDEFWKRSITKKLKHKIMDCHPYSDSFENGVDFRIKMCTVKDLKDLTSIFHEMGHIQYFMAYRNLSVWFRESANSGFAELFGDVMGLAFRTPAYLRKIGLLSTNINNLRNSEINYLLTSALDNIVFIPFAISIEEYVNSVYNGSVGNNETNKIYWDIVRKNQGIVPPVERTENYFDAGAKYHVAIGFAYTRHLFSYLFQYNIFEAMCNLSGYKGPLHQCHFFNSKEVGAKTLEMMKLGNTRNWRKTMKILTGTTSLNSDSLLTFYHPLYEWLKKKNKELNVKTGW